MTKRQGKAYFMISAVAHASTSTHNIALYGAKGC